MDSLLQLPPRVVFVPVSLGAEGVLGGRYFAVPTELRGAQTATGANRSTTLRTHPALSAWCRVRRLDISVIDQ
ncbi:hypothetical protein ACQ4M3_32220 [Leptolyngbya sp. AN03gr2]|uniref:hypothetical protein n=1 Tax=unclassified Leptolyngbya TaxID=2650499 RepID=UPI003D3241DC